MEYAKFLALQVLKAIKLKTLLFLCIFNTLMFLLWPLGPQYTGLLQEALAPTSYTYAPAASIHTLQKLRDKYVFRWEDWIDLSSVYEQDIEDKSRQLQAPVEKSPKCNYHRFFDTIKRRPTMDFSHNSLFKNCNGNNYLMFHAEPPARIVLLKSANASDAAATTAPVLARAEGGDLSPALSKQDDIDPAYISPDQIDGKSLDAAIQTLATQYTNTSGDNLRFVTTPQTRYLLNSEISLSRAIELLDQDAVENSNSTKPSGFFTWLFSSFHSQPSALANLPQTLSTVPGPRLARLYNPSRPELVARVQKSIDYARSLLPFHRELQTDTPPATRLLITKESVQSYVDFLPSRWRLPSYSVLTQNGQPGSDTGIPQLEDLYHASVFRQYNSTAATADKYMHEFGKGGYDAFHSDFRFFRKSTTEMKKNENLHYLFRAWAKFAQQEGIVSWLAHGALIGWHWNGVNLPWDSDIDIQMSVAELDRVARKYNNTLIVDTDTVMAGAADDAPADIMGRGVYLLDVSPNYFDRNKSNKENVIDARFIDAHSGLFIDITGIARNANRTESQTPQYGCKNYHFYELDDLYPLRLTLFEGAPIYVPNNYHKILDEEYKHWKEPAFAPYVFNRQLGLWVHRLLCRPRTKILDALEQTYQSGTRREFLTRTEPETEPEEDKYCGKQQVERYAHAVGRLAALHEREMAYIDDALHQNSHRAAGLSRGRDARTLTELTADERRELAAFLTLQPPGY